MCELHTHSTIQVNARRFDPSRTTTLRNRFTRSMNKRFDELTKVIREAIVDRDCFGLQSGYLMAAQMLPPGFRQFDFPLTAQKVQGFTNWLEEQIARGILETRTLQQIGTGIDPSWTNTYIYDSYKRGVLRGRYELLKRGYDVPTIEQSGGIDVVMQTPFHVDRVGVIFSRAFSELKGITSQMETQISRILAQGLVDGDNPRLLARKLVSVINGKGIGELGITDSLGRFIPAKRRAQMLARTEVIRAHHAANMQEYRNWRAEGFEVIAELITAQDDRVCEVCMGLEGKRYNLETAESLIPVHPYCRCVVVPVDRRDVAPEEIITKL